MPSFDPLGELSWGEFNGGCQSPEHANSGLLPRRLDQRHVRPIDLSRTCQPFLGKTEFIPPLLETGT
jgi:hypothetical protein